MSWAFSISGANLVHPWHLATGELLDTSVTSVSGMDEYSPESLDSVSTSEDVDSGAPQSAPPTPTPPPNNIPSPGQQFSSPAKHSLVYGPDFPSWVVGWLARTSLRWTETPSPKPSQTSLTSKFSQPPPFDSSCLYNGSFEYCTLGLYVPCLRSQGSGDIAPDLISPQGGSFASLKRWSISTN